MQLGYPHPDYLLEELTAEQLAEWEAYNDIEPIGDWKNDIRMAIIASTITNLFISVYGKRGTKPVTIEQFLPKWNEEGETEVQDPEEMKQILMNLVKDFEEKKDGSR